MSFLSGITDGTMFLSDRKIYEKAIIYLESDDAKDRIKAIRLLHRAFEKGETEAGYQIGVCYLEEKGVPRNRSEALRWLSWAAEKGLGKAMVKLSLLWLEGLPTVDEQSLFALTLKDERHSGRAPDIGKAFRWAEKAVEAGEAEGHVTLGYIRSLDDLAYKNLDDAIFHFREAARAGSVKGALSLGVLLLRGKSDDPDSVKEAAGALLFAAEKNDPTASYYLGGLHEIGSGVEKDLVRSEQLYRVAAAKGMPMAMLRLGMLLRSQAASPQAATESETWLRRAAMKGERQAARTLAEAYDSLADVQESRKWYELAAARHDPHAAFRLAEIARTSCLDGKLPSDVVEWYLQALEDGHAPAVTAVLGILNDATHATDLKSDIITRLKEMSARENAHACLALATYIRPSQGGDLPEARKLFLRAAAAGEINAKAGAAEMIFNGLGGDQDLQQAQLLFLEAARAGHPGAMYATGKLFLGQQGIPKDVSQALSWLRRAAAKGHDQSARLLETLPEAKSERMAHDATI